MTGYSDFVEDSTQLVCHHVEMTEGKEHEGKDVTFT